VLFKPSKLKKPLKNKSQQERRVSCEPNVPSDRLVSCQISDEKPISPLVKALCHFWVSNWTLRLVNLTNTTFRCRVCWTLQITLLLHEFVLFAQECYAFKTYMMHV